MGMFNPYEDDAMSWYDVMQVCESGHMITAYAKSHPEDLVERCARCGARTLMKCPRCNVEIRGYLHMPNVFGAGPDEPPDFCHKCGSEYPWTSKRQKKAEIGKASPIERVEKLLARFHSVARQLRDRHSNHATMLIEDEYDVQDLLHALMKLDFEDIRPEEWTPSYAGSCSKMDFLLKSERIVVEVKKTRSGLQSKEVGEQLIVDIEKYRHHPDCKTLVCFVYDPEGRIGNPKGLKNDLEIKNSAELRLLVCIYPS